MDIDCSSIIMLKRWLDQRIPDKSALDRLIYKKMLLEGSLSIGWNDREPDEPKIIDGRTFANFIIPFSEIAFSEKEATLEKVDPNLVIGGRYIGYSKPNHEDASMLMDNLDEATRNLEREAAHYVRPGPFQIYIASEGKNRVSVYREHARPIAAQVCQTTYPSPEELVLRKVNPWKDVFAIQYTGSEQNILQRISPVQAPFKRSSALVLLPYPECFALFESYKVKHAHPVFSLLAPLYIRQIRLQIEHSFYVS